MDSIFRAPQGALISGGESTVKAFLRTIDIALCCAILALGNLAAHAQSPAAPAVHWQGNVEAAQRLAGQSNRLVLLHFWAPWCKPCMRLDSEVFSQPQFGPALEANYVPVKLNADDSKAIARQYGITQLPIDVIITPAGKLVTILPSPPSAEKYIAQLNEVAAGHRQLAGANPPAAGGAAPAAQPSPPAAPIVGAAYPPAQAQAPGAAAAPPGDRYADYYNQAGQAGGAAAIPAGYPPAAPAAAAGPPGAPNYPSQQPQAAGYYGQQTGAPAGAPAGAPPYGAPQGQQPPGAANGYAQQPGAQPNPSQAYAAQQYPPQAGQQYPGQPNPAQQQYPAQQPPQYPAQPYAGQPAPGQPGAPPVAGANPAAPAVPQLPAGAPPLGMEGYCPVTLVMQKKWVQGDKRWGAIHRGRTYLFAGEDEQKRFLANPDSFSPVMSGNDPVLALDQNQSVAGTRRYGVFMGGRIYLFSNQDTLTQFEHNPKRYAAEVLQAMNANPNANPKY